MPASTGALCHFSMARPWTLKQNGPVHEDICSPWLKRQYVGSVLQSAMSLNVFVANDGLDCCVRVVDQKLINSLQWNCILFLVVV